MNILLYKLKYLALLVVVGFPFIGQAQNSQVEVVDMVTVINEAVSDTYTHQGNYPTTISQLGANGTACINNDCSAPIYSFGSGVKNFFYTPNTDFVGYDTVIVNYSKYVAPAFVNVSRHYYITVLPAYIFAYDDYTFTNEGQTIEIDVLANDDWNNTDEPHVESVSLVNSGDGMCVNNCGAISFTPAPGFSGVAHLNYTICDDMGVCDDAVVNIVVNPLDEPMIDTLHIITTKNAARVVILDLDGYNIVSGAEPTHGSVAYGNMGNVPEYTPNTGFAGYDYFTFANAAGYERLVEVHVLDIATNEFLNDDLAHTTLNTSVEINALSNDEGGQSLTGIIVTEQPAYGTVSSTSVNGNIHFVYEPIPGFSGLDKFVYRANVAPGITEKAEVTIIVDNVQPAKPIFQLSTPKNTPLVIEYGAPITNFSFVENAAPTLGGSIEFFEGYSEFTWNGQTVSGYNLLVYTPAVDSGIEEVELKYCIEGGPCPEAIVKLEITIEDIVVPTDAQCIGKNCVWKGDTNRDGIVNMKDILPIGMCMGEVGDIRPEVNLSQWYGEYADDWNDPFDMPGFDLKHIDTNGDSIVSVADTLAIRNHYNRTHSIVASIKGQTPVPVFLKTPADVEFTVGDWAYLEIWVGDTLADNRIAKDLHGFTAKANYQSDLVDANSVRVSFNDHTWLSYDSPAFGMDYNHPELESIDYGYTRTNGISQTGYGLVGRLDFIVIEDLSGIRPGDEYIYLPFSTEGGTAMTSNGTTYELVGSETILPIKLPTAKKEAITANDLRMMPNPASDYVTLYLNGYGNEIVQYEVFNLNGQRIYQSAAVNAKSDEVNVANWTPGMYVVRMLANSGEVVNAKFEVIK